MSGRASRVVCAIVLVASLSGCTALLTGGKKSEPKNALATGDPAHGAVLAPIDSDRQRPADGQTGTH
jgi:hypothetical protein